MQNQLVIIISRGKGNSSLVPCTCSTRMRRATRIGLSFLNIYNSKGTQKAELASTRKLPSFFSPCPASTLIRTPSESGFSAYLLITRTSNEKFMFDRFLKGIFIVPLLGIFMILVPDRLSSSSLRQMI